MKVSCILAILIVTGTLGLAPQPAGASLEDQARRSAAAGNYKEAVRLYELLAAREPSSVSVFVNLGVAYARLGQFARAAKAYRAALAINPRSLPALVNLGLAEFKSGHFAGALEPLEAALRLDPANRQALTLLAMSRFSLRQFEPAARYLEMLFQADPGNTTVQYLLGESYFRSHQQPRLEKFLRQVSRISPDSAALHMLAGEAYDRLNRTDEAIQEFRAAERSDPPLPRIHFYLGYLYWEKRDDAAAATEFQAELASPGGEHAQAQGYLGDIAMRSGDPKRAGELFRRAILADPGVRIAHLNLGILSAGQHQWTKAEREFKAAIALDPNRADAYYRLAQVYRAENKAAQQKAMLSKVKEINEAQRRSVESVFTGASPRPQ